MIVTGAYDNGSGSGSAYVFTTSSDYGSKITTPDRTTEDMFGHSVGVSGNVILIGALGDDDNGEDSGSVNALINYVNKL